MSSGATSPTSSKVTSSGRVPCTLHLRGYPPIDLRHTFAMLNVTAGKADTRTVQRLLRQSSPAAALRYQHAAASALEQSASVLDALVPVVEVRKPPRLRAV